MFYEERIQQENPDLYQVIREYVPSLPDFRPLDTIKQMRAESQNNWKLIYNELETFSYRSDYLEIFHLLSHNERKKLLPFFKETSLLEEFLHTYPALVWLLRYISPTECTWGFYIFFGIYLKDIPMEAEYILYIRDLKTAEKLYARDPNLVNSRWIKKIIIFHYHINDALLIGYLYWFYFLKEKEIIKSSFPFYAIPALIILVNDMNLAPLYLHDLKSWENHWIYLQKILCEKASEDMLMYILSRVFTDDMVRSLLGYSMETNNERTFSLCSKEYNQRKIHKGLSIDSILHSSLFLHCAIPVAYQILETLVVGKPVAHSDLFKMVVKEKNYNLINLLIREGYKFFSHYEKIPYLLLENAIIQTNEEVATVLLSSYDIPITDDLVKLTLDTYYKSFFPLLLRNIKDTDSLSSETLENIKKEKENVLKKIKEYEELLESINHALKI